MKRRRYQILLIVSLAFWLGLFLILWPSGRRCEIALFLQGRTMEGTSLFKKRGLHLQIPLVQGFTPSMKLFHAGEVLPQTQVTVLYNFGAWRNQRSTFYDPSSPLYNTHYGAYAIAGPQPVLAPAPLAEIFRYDQLGLVLESLGFEGPGVFQWRLTQSQQNVRLSGFSDWQRLDAEVYTNGPLHAQTAFLPGYLQYGSPPPYRGEPFAPVSMAARLYVRYDAVADLTIVYYILTSDAHLLQTVDERALQKIQWVRGPKEQPLAP
ncbi:hypothetical protein ABB02_01249 [Clostridiaceae bacterium JG1575]|nr:hypothetical protein ABB02_01249 [Clostridiaceae bacterium JG1575]